MAPIRDLVSHSPNQTDLNHGNLSSQYENAPWSSGSPGSDSDASWAKAIVDGCDGDHWSSLRSGDPELASECMDADSASSSGSEQNLNVTASGSNGSCGRQGSIHGGCFTVASSGGGSTPLSSAWGTFESPTEMTGGTSVENGHGKLNTWSAIGSVNGEGNNASTLNPNANHGAWPVGNGASSTGVQQSNIGQASGVLPGSHPKADYSNHGAWCAVKGDNSNHNVNGTSTVSLGVPPQNLNTENNGPNNTTNPMTSSLPNSTGSGKAADVPSGHPAWLAGAAQRPSTGEAYSPVWGTLPDTNYPGDKPSVPEDQPTGDTVNGTLMQPGMNRTAPFKNVASDDNATGAQEGGWDSSARSWVSNSSGAPPRPWGGSSYSSSSSSSSSSNAGPQISNGEWNSMPNNGTLPCDRKGTGVWKSLEDDALGSASHTGSTWARGSEGSGEDSSISSHGERDSNRVSSASRKKNNPPPVAANMVARADLDPRVLSNTGWGQTPVRQNTAWDVSTEKKPDNGTVGWGNTAPQTTGGWGNDPPSRSTDTVPAAGWGDSKPASGWGDAKSSAVQGGWGVTTDPSGVAKSSQSWGSTKEDKTSSWTNTQKPKSGWSGTTGTESWGGDSSHTNQWVDPQKSGSAGWDSDSDRSGSGWGETGRGGSTSGSWDNNSKTVSSGWGEAVKHTGQNQGWGETGPGKGWGELVKPVGRSAPGWGDGSNSSEWSKAPESTKPSPTTPQPAQNKPSGWLGGPMPVAHRDDDSTGWEEPSPESIRRKMEIDDGTSAWGDPSKYNYNNVNMWDPKGRSESDGPKILQRPSSSMPARDKPSSGWDEPTEAPQKCKPSWGEPVGPHVSVDNGTSAWGKPADSGSTWEDPSRGDTNSSGWGGSVSQAPQYNNAKHTQESWRGDMSLAGSSRQTWEEDEEEEVEIGMWNNNLPQEASQSGNWSHMKKSAPKINKGPIKQEDVWMSPFVKQFNNMSFPRENSEDIPKSGKMDIPGGMHGLNTGEYVFGKGPGSRHQNSKESGMERGLYYDKLSLAGHDSYASQESQSDQFSASRNTRFPPLNNPLINQGLGSSPGPNHPNASSVRQSSGFGGSAVGAQGRGPQQLPTQSLNSVQLGLRAQVPPPLLPSQVPPSLKYPPNNGGLNPLFGPQQMAMLNQLSQLNQLNQLSQLNQLTQLQRLLQQQQKMANQRSMTVGLRPQQEHQNRPPGPPQTLLAPSRHMDTSMAKQQSSPQSLPPLQQTSSLKSYLESINPQQHPPDMQRESLANFTHGLNSSSNVNGVDNGFMGFKEPQSRLKKWTALDIPMNSPLEQNPSKPGALSAGLRLEDSAFGPYDFMNPSSSPVSPPGSVGDGWPGRAKSPHTSNVAWPPEFRPGEPWKGYPNIDPETDPYVTPGSVNSNFSISTVREVDHLRDRSNGPTSSLNTTLPLTSAWSSNRASTFSGSLSSTAQSTSARPGEPECAWSTGTSTSLAHELWKVPLSKGSSAPSRPPPGLSGQKPAPSWDSGPLRLGGWGSSDSSRFTPGSSWADTSSGRTTNWLVLKNLTPQIDGSTLRTLCMQHGPLITFHLNLPHGNAVVCYSSKEEAAKAQKSLHMCVLGNTTILAEFASEEEISRFFAQGQSAAAATPSWQNLSSSQSRAGPAEGSHQNHWGGTGELHSSSLWGGPNYSTSLWGNSRSEGRGIASPSPIGSFLPVDHLAGGGDSM